MQADTDASTGTAAATRTRGFQNIGSSAAAAPELTNPAVTSSPASPGSATAASTATPGVTGSTTSHNSSPAYISACPFPAVSVVITRNIEINFWMAEVARS